MQLVQKFKTSGSIKRVNKDKRKKASSSNNSTREAVSRQKNADYRSDPKSFYENGSQPLAPQLIGFSADKSSDPNESGYMQEMLLPEANVFPNDQARSQFLDRQWESYMRERSANSVWNNAVSKGLTGPTAKFWEQIAMLGVGGSMAVAAALPVLADLAYDMAAEFTGEQMAAVGQNVVRYLQQTGPQGAQYLRNVMQMSGPRTVSQLLQSTRGAQAIMQQGVNTGALVLDTSVDLMPYVLGTTTALSGLGIANSRDMAEEAPAPIVIGGGAEAPVIPEADDNVVSVEPIVIGPSAATTGGGNAEPEDDEDEDLIEEESDFRPNEPEKKGFFRRLFGGKKPARVTEEPVGNTRGTSNPTPASSTSSKPTGWWGGWNNGWNYIKPWKPQGLLQWGFDPLWHHSREYTWPAVDKTAGRALNWFVTGNGKPISSYFNDSIQNNQQLQDPQQQVVQPTDSTQQQVKPTNGDTIVLEEPTYEYDPNTYVNDLNDAFGQ